MATLNEIAEAAGVTKMTVSNILNGKNKETYPSAARRAARIRALAKEMNYRPNGAAKAVANGSFGSIGLLSSSNVASGSIFHPTLQAIRTSVRERDLHLTLGDLPDAELTSEEVLPKILREWSVDGLIISYISAVPTQMVELIRQHQIPSIWLNIKMDEDCVYPDDYNAGKRATRYLLELGHRRIAYADTISSSHFSVTERRRGYCLAMRTARCQTQIMNYEGPYENSDWVAQSREWLQDPDRPTAVVTYADSYAYAIYCAALSLGLRVPEDLSIVTVLDQVANHLGFPMTTLLIPAEEMGLSAVDMLQQKIQKPYERLQPRKVAYGLHKGRTCAPPAITRKPPLMG